MIDAVDDFDGLRRQVEEARLEPVQRFDANDDAPLSSVLGKLFQLADEQIEIFLALVRRRLPGAPDRAVERPHHVGGAERLRRVDAMPHVGGRICTHAGVGVQQVAVRAHRRANARAETKIFDDGGRFLVVEISGALDRDFEQIESQPRDMLCDLRKAVGGQRGGPDPARDADLHGLTLGSGFKVQGSRFTVQGSRFRVHGSEFTVQSSRFTTIGFGLQT